MARAFARRKSDTAFAKLAVIALLGAGAAGALTLHARITAPAPAHAERAVRVLTDPLARTRVAIDARSSRAEPSRGATSADRRALLDAATRGDRAIVETLHAKGVALDGTLENAAASGDATLVRWLLEHGVSATEGEALSVPPLLLADDHQEVVDLLLARGAREVALERAVAAGAPNAVRRALAKGASTKAAPEAEPLLVTAVRSATGAKRRAVLEALAAARAPLDAEDAHGESALSVLSTEALHAVPEGPSVEKPRAQDLVALLVARGAKVSGGVLAAVVRGAEPQRAPLLEVLLGGRLAHDATLAAVSAATEAGDAAAVKKLAAKGVSWASLDKGTTTPLERAIVDGDPSVVRALLDASAPTGRIGGSSNPALVTAVTAASGESDAAIEIVRVLLDRGASPNVKGLEGRTPLFAAAQQGSERLVTMLVAKGARVDDEVDGMTPREAAELAGHDGVVKLLRARGARATLK